MQEKNKKTYEKPLLTRHQKLTAVTAQAGSVVPLGCTRF
ncbi:MAG: putative RiPP precursor [Deltaproteobacteria bacterium]|nr:putative RiPP precursor [Deltaproteobacteria bacterium]